MLRTLRLLMLLVAAAMIASAPFLIVAAPNEATMGLVYKIIYFHVPSAILTLSSAIVCGVASIGFLLLKRPKADHWAVAAAELVVLFGAITLVTGPIWGRKAWGVWWVWDVRLTSTLLLWMVFVAYMLLRRFGGPGSDKLSAVMAHAASPDLGHPDAAGRDGGAVLVLRHRVPDSVSRAPVDARPTGGAAGEGRGPLPRCG
jgi:heme exporter protein C